MNQEARSKKQGTTNMLSVVCYLLSEKGFTLVELLVVIAVVASVLAVVFPNFVGARQRARDTQRKNDLKQIQSSMELYKLDQNPPAYPTGGGFLSSCGSCWSSEDNCSGNIYMRKVPCDPSAGTNSPYLYATPSPYDSLKYTISACLENQVDADKDLTPVPTCVASYTVHEP